MEEKKQSYHVPVMLDESVKGLNIQEGGIYVDVTFGGGGPFYTTSEVFDSIDRKFGWK